MLHTYRDAITGRIYQVYDDEPPDELEDEEYEPEEEEADCQDVYQKECDRYYNWLYQ